MNITSSDVQMKKSQCQSNPNSAPPPRKETEDTIASNVELSPDVQSHNTYVEVKQEEAEPPYPVAWNLSEILPIMHGVGILDPSIRVKQEPSQGPNAAMDLDLCDDPVSFSELVVEEIEIKEEPIEEGLLEVDPLDISSIKSESDVDMDRFIGDDALTSLVLNLTVPNSALSYSLVPNSEVSNLTLPNSALRKSLVRNSEVPIITVPNSAVPDIRKSKSSTVLLKVIKPNRKIIYLQLRRTGGPVQLAGNLGKNSGLFTMAKQRPNSGMKGQTSKTIKGHIGSSLVAKRTPQTLAPAPVALDTGPVQDLRRSLLQLLAIPDVCVKQEPPDDVMCSLTPSQKKDVGGSRREEPAFSCHNCVLSFTSPVWRDRHEGASCRRRRFDDEVKSALPYFEPVPKVIASAFEFSKTLNEPGPETKKKHRCGECSYSTDHSGNLKQHVLTHMGEKAFSCPHCVYKSTRNSDLQRHLRTHTGDKPFACTLCDFKAAEKGNLASHMLTHTGDKPFQCTECEFAATTSSHLQRHVRAKHSKEHPYACTECEYTCVQSSTLTRHMLTHTGDKPFQCTECEYAATTSSSLLNHVRSKHSKEHPYACTECEYTCVESGSLTRHMTTHTGVKKFACQDCTYSCNQRSELKKHQKAKHAAKASQ